MQRDQDRRQAAGRALVELGCNGGVVGRGDFVESLPALSGGQAGVAGDGRPIADLRDRVGPGGVAVAVDDQARVALADEGGAEHSAEQGAQFRYAYVPGDVAPAFCVGKPQPRQP